MLACTSQLTPTVRATFAALLLAVLLPAIAAAQRVDSASASVVKAPEQERTTIPDSLRPPVTPRRAFLYSLLAPGYSQSLLGRHRAAVLMLAFEGIALAMIHESAADLQEARRTANDSVVISYVTPGNSATRTIKAPRFDDDYVRVRRSHLEDWIAVLIANHLFSGADAFVAANLWDVPAQLSVRVTPGRAVLGASLSW